MRQLVPKLVVVSFLVVIAFALLSAAPQQVINPGGSSGGAGTGTCTNQVVTAVLGGGPTCTTVTSAYVDSSIAASANYQTTATAQAAYSGHGSCTNQVVTAANANAAPTCTTLTSAYLPSSTSWENSISASNTGAVPSSAANKALVWGFTLPVQVTTTQITYFVGANADNTATYNYDLGIYNSSGTLVLNVSGGSLHGSTFAPATGSTTISWVQGSTTLSPGAYYLFYYTSNTTSTPPTLYGAAGNAPAFYKLESGSSGAQGSSGFSITPQTGGILPTSITPPTAALATSYEPMFWLH
jgi:hypothetical protein